MQNPLALTAGVAPRLLLVAALLAFVWLAVLWAMA
jgi:hypothetical protein